MKKLIEQELPFCDWCEDPAFYPCEGCDKDICDKEECKEKFKIYWKILGKGFFCVCNDCKELPSAEIGDNLLLYQQLKVVQDKETKHRKGFIKKITQIEEKIIEPDLEEK